MNPKDNAIVQEYILPDLSINRKGRIRQQDDLVTETDQILMMNNERFTVPEVIFRPDDIGASLSTISQVYPLELIEFRSGSVWLIRHCCAIDLPSATGSPRDVLGQHRSDWWQYKICRFPVKIVGVLVTISLVPDLYDLPRMSELQSLAPVGSEVVIYECDE